MMNKSVVRLYACVAMTAALVAFAAAPARAQFQPRPLNDPATGERYHIEASGNFWFPTADFVVSSESLGIQGSQIDAKRDLGLTDQRFPELRLVLRPSRTSKFRFQYIPIKYTQGPTTLQRTIVFNGQRYTVGLPVNSTLDWKAYRMAYEFDFVAKDRGYAGFIVEAKYTDIQVQLASPFVNEFARARAPIPALGGIGRVYVVPNISATFEMTGFKLPEHLVKNTYGRYIDWDLYGTLNFTNNIGVQAGYRSLDVGVAVNASSPLQCPTLPSTGTGSCFTLKGAYLGVVARY
jgi:hypothetical protein